MVAAALTSTCAAKPALLKVSAKTQQRAARVARPVVCSAQKKEAVAAGVTAAAIAVLANPLAAEAAVTPSLNNLLGSVFAGATVLALIAGAITAVSNYDKIRS